MTKDKFLKQLRKKLSILNHHDMEEIINEYTDYIDEKIMAGSSEKDAVKSFGNIDDLARELIKNNQLKRESEENKDPIGTFAKKVSKVIDEMIQYFHGKGPKEIIQFIVEILLIVLAIFLYHIPVHLLVNLGKDVFYILASPFNRIFYTVWEFVLEFAYIILAIVVFAKIFDRRYLKEVKLSKTTYQNNKPFNSAIDTVIKVCVFLLKFIAICILFGMSVYLIGMVVILVLCIYLLFHQVFYFGFYIVMIALFIIGIILFNILYHFVLNRKNNNQVFISLVISFILLGIGCGVASIEYTDTEYINHPPEDVQTEVLSEELSMDDDTVFIANISNYEVDNSLDHVIVEYHYYPLGNTMATDIQKSDQFVYLNYKLTRFYLKKDFLNHIVEDLKNRKIYNYYIEPTITIKTSEKNIAIIKKNRQKYYENESKYSTCQFVRTYYVDMVKDNKANDYVSVVLSEYGDDNMTTVKLKRNVAGDMKMGNNYEITFKTYQSYVDTNIMNIFAENEVVSVKKTDKVGTEQVQDTACSVFY